MKKLFLLLVLMPQFAFAAYSIPLSATTTTGTIFAFPTAVNGVLPNLTSPFFVATSTRTSIFPYASSTALTAGNLFATNATFTNALPVASGGTAINSYTPGDILYASAATVLSRVASSTSGRVLALVNGIPTWVATTTLTTITGTLPIANGGTGQTSFAQGWLGVDNSLAIISSTSPTVAFITATSTTASSTFKGVTATYLNLTGASTATSTSAHGFDIAGGCFSIAGSCLQTIVSSASAYKQAVRYASTSTLPTNVYNNGTGGVGATLTGSSNAALYIDGNTPTTGDRVLVKNESTGANNGIYTVTQLGSGILPYILTRATDYNSSADVFPGVANFVNGGTINANTCWILTNTTSVTIGTTALTYADECGAGSFTASYPILLSGTTFSWGGLATSGPFSNNAFVYTSNTGTLTTAASSSLNLPNTALANSSLNFTYTGNVSGTASAALGGTISVTVPWEWISLNNFSTSTVSTSTSITAYSFFSSSTQASQFPYASTTALTMVTGSTTNLIVSGIGGTANNCLQASATGVISGTGSSCSTSANAGFTFSTIFGTANTAATTSQMQITGGLAASSTIRFGNAGVSGQWLYDATNGREGIGSTTPTMGLSIGTTGLVYPSIAVTENPVATSTAMVIDWSTGNTHLLQVGTAAYSIAFINASTTGMTQKIITCNPGSAAGALTWKVPSILWAGGTTPAQTTAANKCDVYSCIVTQATSTTASVQKLLCTGTANF